MMTFKKQEFISLITKNMKIYGSAGGLSPDSSSLEIATYLDIDFFINNFLCCEVSKLFFSMQIRDGYYSHELFRYLKNYGLGKGIQFAFILFRIGIMEE